MTDDVTYAAIQGVTDDVTDDVTYDMTYGAI